MKSFTLLLSTAVLCMFSLCSCRASDEQIKPSPVLVRDQMESNAFDNEPDPPKDEPKDYDDWKMKIE